MQTYADIRRTESARVGLKMSLHLPSIISNSFRPHYPFLILESSLVQSCLPILRAIVAQKGSKGHTLLFCLLHPPSSLVDDPALQSENLKVFDRTHCVPEYDDDYVDPRDFILDAVKAGEQTMAELAITRSFTLTSHPRSVAPPGPLNVIIDSADLLCDDIGSPSQTHALIISLLQLIRARPCE